MKTGKSSLNYKLNTPVDPSKSVVEQLFATSTAGTKVPYFVVKGKDFKPDGTARALVYGYGGFLAGQRPAFTSSAYPWLERGGIYVVTNLRGGDEYGETWHEAGMGHKKQNVFDDLYAVLEKIAADKYTRADKITLRGASNGGLLVGAAITRGRSCSGSRCAGCRCSTWCGTTVRQQADVDRRVQSSEGRRLQVDLPRTRRTST